MKKLNSTVILIKGAGEVASAVAHKLHRSHFKVCCTEIPQPIAVSRGVSFCEAVYDGEKEVEGVKGIKVNSEEEIYTAWQENKLPVMIDPETIIRNTLKPDVIVDAIMAKRNINTRIGDAPLVIGLGPGFYAGKDCHAVIETNNSENLGKVILRGEAEPHTGIPLEVGGLTTERASFAKRAGVFHAERQPGDHVHNGDIIARIDDEPVRAMVDGALRALLRDGLEVTEHTKLAEVDPRDDANLFYTIRPRTRTIAGGVLEAILLHLNR